MEIFKGYLPLSCILLSGAISKAISPSSIESRIINGNEVTWNNTRYQVSVRLESIDRIFYGSGHMCGGSLISKNIVLTAAHCIWNDNLDRFRNPSEFSIVMGSLDRSIKTANTLKFGVRHIILSSNFNAKSFRDDIAIMVMDRSVPDFYSGSFIIELNDDRYLAVGTKCIVTGWGSTEKRVYPQKLMSVEVPIISIRDCSLNYGRQSIMPGMLCAGYMAGERDACAGDSGGPLVCDNKLVGVVSFGIGCALPGYPGVYADIAYYVNWIRNLMGLRNRFSEFLSEPMAMQNSTTPTNTHFKNYTILSNFVNSNNTNNKASCLECSILSLAMVFTVYLTTFKKFYL